MSEKSGKVTGEPLDVESLTRYFSDLSPQPLVVVEGATHIVRYLNPAFAKLAGKVSAEMVGRTFAEAVPEASAECVAVLDRVYLTGVPETLIEQENAHAPPVNWSYSVWAISGTDSRPTGLVIQVTDTTEMAIFRSQTVAINEQLLISSARQHELTEAAERANQIKDEFLAILSHELRTPLTSILGWAGMLGSAKLDEATTARAISVIRRNARIQVQMINDLLDHARIITGKLRLSMAPLDLGAIILATVDGLRPAADAKEISIQLQLDPATGKVSGDADRLRQVAWNLISNAIKFTPKGGNVIVGLKRVGSEYEASVTDTGMGISPAFLPHVFERFRQADGTSTRPFGGLGLGLAIVRQLVELHGGTVRVFSEGEGKGSTFTVSLPAIAAQGAEHLEAHEREVINLQEFECTRDLRGTRVLLVDDEPDTRELLEVILKGCNAQVRTVHSAEGALEALATETFDVLISDIGLPNEDGYSLMTKVRALSKERGGAIPAAALTAYVGDEDRVRVLKAGFHVHVPKPIHPGDLVSIVANLAGVK